MTLYEENEILKATRYCIERGHCEECPLFGHTDCKDLLLENLVNCFNAFEEKNAKAKSNDEPYNDVYRRELESVQNEACIQEMQGIFNHLTSDEQQAWRICSAFAKLGLYV